MTTLNVNTSGIPNIRPTYGKFPVSSSSSTVPWTLQNNIDILAGTYHFSTQGDAIGDVVSATNATYNQGGLYGEQISTSTARNTIASGDVGITLPFTNATLFTSISYGDIGDNYAYMWIGFFKPPTTGTYTFYTSSDDGSGVWIGDIASDATGRTASNAVVNNDMGSGHANQERSGTISLTADVYYPIRIVHEEGTSGSNMTFSWAGPSISKTTDLSQYFYYSGDGLNFTAQITIGPADVYEETLSYGNGVAPNLSFYDRKRVQVSAENTITYAPKHFRESVLSINNTVPYNLAELRQLDGTRRQYKIARAISSDGGAGGGGDGGGTAEIQTWY
jgi:hypothetical protein